MRRKLGAFFMILGVLAILSAAGLLVYNARQDRQAGEASAQVLPRMEQVILERREQAAETQSTVPSPTEAPEQIPEQSAEMPTAKIDGHSYVGFLSMPTIRRELPVMAELQMPYLRTAPCRYYGSTYRDNLAIAAHNYDRHFGPISDLKPGDPVYFTDMDGIVNTYEVMTCETLRPMDIDLVKDGEGDLILFTCTYGGASRVTVRCVRTAGF